MKHLLFITIFISSYYLSYSQSYSDQKEYGWRGKVKKVVSYNYDSLTPNIKKGIIINPAYWRSKIIFYVNIYGNIEKKEVYSKPPLSLDSLFKMTINYKYQNHGRVGYQLDQNGKLIDTLKFQWLSETHYKIVEVNSAGKIDLISEADLTKNYRDYWGYFVMYDQDRKVDYGERYVNTIDKENRFIKSVKTFIKTNKIVTTYFKYVRLDKSGNAEETHLSNVENGQPYMITVKHFSYY